MNDGGIFIVGARSVNSADVHAGRAYLRYD
jgi:hypothetical protein